MSGHDPAMGPSRRRLLGLAESMSLGILAVISAAPANARLLRRPGTEELAANSFAVPAVFTLTSLAIGLDARAASAVSRSLGEGDRDAVRRPTALRSQS